MPSVGSDNVLHPCFRPLLSKCALDHVVKAIKHTVVLLIRLCTIPLCFWSRACAFLSSSSAFDKASTAATWIQQQPLLYYYHSCNAAYYPCQLCCCSKSFQRPFTRVFLYVRLLSFAYLHAGSLFFSLAWAPSWTLFQLVAGNCGDQHLSLMCFFYVNINLRCRQTWWNSIWGFYLAVQLTKNSALRSQKKSFPEQQ